MYLWSEIVSRDLMNEKIVLYLTKWDLLKKRHSGRGLQTERTIGVWVRLQSYGTELI